MTQELKPCPFCGAKIIYISKNYIKIDCPDCDPEEQAKAICNSCGCSTQYCYTTNSFTAEQNARTAWNTRTPEALKAYDNFTTKKGTRNE